MWRVSRHSQHFRSDPVLAPGELGSHQVWQLSTSYDLPSFLFWMQGHEKVVNVARMVKHNNERVPLSSGLGHLSSSVGTCAFDSSTNCYHVLPWHFGHSRHHLAAGPLPHAKPFTNSGRSYTSESPLMWLVGALLRKLFVERCGSRSIIRAWYW